MKYIINTLLLCGVLLFTACSNTHQTIQVNPTIKQNQSLKKQPALQSNQHFVKTEEVEEIEDLKTLSQNPTTYTKNLPVFNTKIQKQLDNKFNQLFFQPWELKKMSHTKKEASWSNMYMKKKMYAHNHKLISKEWFNKQIKNANFERYDTTKKYAVTTNNSNMRVFPTKDSMFYNPKKAGEGFPFDYNQNSSLKLNTPLYISHFSKDRAWVFVESNFAIGWVAIQDIAFIDEVLRNKFKSGTYFVATQDNFPIYKNGVFVEYIKMGTIFPLRKNKFVTINKHANLQGYLSYVKIENQFVQMKPLKFNRVNINKISSAIAAEPYGWGGIMNKRDCSAFTKDFFAPFGIYLKRNSFGQTKRGEYINLKEFELDEKKKQIIKSGIPFLTLIYLKGHIMLYIGEHNGEPLVFHNVWGVKTLESNGEEGRFVIGRAVITTLEPGRELPNFVRENNILAKIEGMVIVNK